MTDKKERLFVIMEVESVPYDTEDGTEHFEPVGAENGEYMWLNPSRVIPESRLRYGKPQKDDTYFAPELKWVKWILRREFDEMRLILDPAPGEKDEWEEWADSAPTCIDDRTKNWIKRMPRRKDGTT